MISVYLILLLIFSAFFLGFDISSFPLISPDEPRYAETAREMIERADFITPYCNYEPRFDKPILFYWFEIIAFKLFGLNEFAARLPSVLAGTGMVALAFLMNYRHGFGFIAAIITMTSLKVFLASKLAITDMVLCFFISAALVFFYLGYENRGEAKQKFAFKNRLSSHWFTISIVMMAFGVLCKGPVALALPLLTIVLFLFFQKDLRNFLMNTWIDLLVGMIAFLIMVLPWYIMVHNATGGDFSQEFFLSHNFKRFVGVHTGHSAPFWFYVPVLVAGLFPWSFFLLQSIFSFDFSATYNPRSEKAMTSRLLRYCLLWALVVFLFFTISSTKLPTYILPVYLPLITIISKWWKDKFKTQRSGGYNNLDALVGLGLFTIVVIAGVILGLTVLKKKLLVIHSAGFLMPIAVIGFLFIGAGLIAMTAALHRAKVSFIFLALASVFSYLVGTKYILKTFAWHRDSGSKIFATSLKAEDTLVSYRTHQTRFAFYAQREIPRLGNKKFYEFLSQSGPDSYFVSKTRYINGFHKFLEKRADDSLAPVNYEIIQKAPVYVYGVVRD